MHWLGRFALAVCAAAVAVPAVAVPDLTATQVVERNVAARGGLQAWRGIQTMIWVGHMESEHAPAPTMQFVLYQERPNKTRFDIDAIGHKSLRVFDGARGWKTRPGRGGKPDVQPYSTPELEFARAQPGLDGPLIDYAAKGNSVQLEGVDEIEGRKTFRLGVRLASGERHQVWVDAQTFLDVRDDRLVQAPGGAAGRVSVYYRDYRTIDGLQIPSIVETGVGTSATPDRLMIERVMLNPVLDQSTFAQPGTRTRRAKIAAGTRSEVSASEEATVPFAPMPHSATKIPDPGSGPR